MAKGVVLGVEKMIKKPLITRIRRNKIKKKKSILKKVVDYLKSDSYMFAPLFSHHSPFGFLPSNVAVSSYSTPGVKNGKEKKKKSLLVEEFGEYLNSDSYLYAPLFPPPSIGLNNDHLKRVVVSEKNQETNATVEKAASEEEDGHVVLQERRRRRRRIISSSKLVEEYKKKEKTVKQHMFYQCCCRSSSLSGKRRLNSQLRKYLIE